MRRLVWVGLVVRMLSRGLPVHIRILRVVVRHDGLVALRDRYSDEIVKTIWRYERSLHRGPLETFLYS